MITGVDKRLKYLALMFIVPFVISACEKNNNTNNNERQDSPKDIDTVNKPSVKFGLPESKRKEIFWEIVKAEDQAEIDAGKKYPTDIDNQGSSFIVLTEKYNSEISAKYKITNEQRDAIAVEGIEKKWPMPPLNPNRP